MLKVPNHTKLALVKIVMTDLSGRACKINKFTDNIATIDSE